MGLCKYVISTIKQSFENRCLILLLDAYNLSIIENRCSVDWLENDFTEALDYYIAKSPKRIKWNISNHTEQHLHNETQVEKGFADKEKRIDLKMSHISCNKEFHFYVEAKRLKEHDSYLKRRYIDTGIDNYVHAIYPKGILVGYLLVGSVDNTICGINKILIKDNRSTEKMIRKEHSSYQYYFESTHSGYGVLRHFILNYTK